MKPNRDWTRARAKVEAEGRCRRCAREGVRLEAAHVIGRGEDWGPTIHHEEDWRPGLVMPDRIVPLCRLCHRRYDGQEPRIDVLPILTMAEQLQAVADAGGISQALDRLAPTESRRRVRSTEAGLAFPGSR